MEIIKSTHGDYLIMKIKGKIAMEEAAHLKERVEREIDAGSVKIVLDLENVEFIDSMGLGMMMALSNRLSKSREKLKLINVNEKVAGVMELSMLHTIFKIYKSVDELNS